MLAHRIAEALETGSLILVAEAGFGKTTVLGEGLLAACARTAWVSATPAHREPGPLLANLMDTLRAAVPGAADVLAERLATGAEPLDPLVAARSLVSDLERLLVERLVLVIDDAECLEAATESLELVNFLLGAAPDFLGVAIASRRGLGLRTAKLQAAGRLRELGPAELAFSAGECAELLDELRGGAAPSEEVDRLMSATHGWPLGIALAARAGAAEAGRDRSREGVFAFLAEEVLNDLEPQLRQAVTDSSVPAELNSEVLDALGLPEDLLEELANRALFVRPLDPGERSYRYHPLFREFLLERLHAERPPGRVRELHAGAARALSAEGRPAEALEHWLEAEAWPEAVSVLAREGAARSSGRRETIRAPPRCSGWPSPGTASAVTPPPSGEAASP